MRKAAIAVAVLGVVAGILLTWQVVSGLTMRWSVATATLKTAHTHGGLTTATVTLLYIVISVVLILNLPSGTRGGGED